MLAERFGWGPEVVNELTPFQAAAYLGALTPETPGDPIVSPDALPGLIGRKRMKELGFN